MTTNETGRAEQELFGTGEQLKAHIEAWAAGLDEQQTSTKQFVVALGLRLADRIDEGVDPVGYVFATEFLTADCLKGVDGYTGEPLSLSIAGFHPMAYSLFRVRAASFARGAFGDAFADKAEEFWKQASEQSASL